MRDQRNILPTFRVAREEERSILLSAACPVVLHDPVMQ